MKRLLIMLVCTTAFVALGAANATGAGRTHAPTLTIASNHYSVVAGQTVLLSGVYTPGRGPAAQQQIKVFMYDNPTCAGFGDRLATVTTIDHAYRVGPITMGDVGKYSFKAETTWGGADDEAHSNCVLVEVAAAEKPVTPPPVTPPVTPPAEPFLGPSSYLCWNREMVNPVAYYDSVADQMWTTGNYIEPQAILGNVPGGTNIGAYHLVCNAPATMTPTGYGLGGSGEVYTPDTMAAYHLIHSGGNDLNLYHIYN